MKRVFSPHTLSTILIASATFFTACQQQSAPVPEKQSGTTVESEASSKTVTEIDSDGNREALAKKEAEEAALKEGEAIYRKSCQSCHSLSPPAKSAPSIIALASQYRSRYSKKAGAVADMASFMKAPAVEKSILGAGTFERFGLMPPVTLPDDELEKVAGWLWEQYDPDFEGGGDCQ
ncbi:MAG: cytochrome c [Chlorobiales bacterium]|nr:cytochrome c [Chlorobiales bacterium]